MRSPVERKSASDERETSDLGETDPVRAHRFDHRDGGSVRSEMHAYPEEDAPGLLVLHRHEDDEGVLDVLARRPLDAFAENVMPQFR